MKTERLSVVVRLLRRLVREWKLVTAFAPTPSGLQREIDLQAWMGSRTDEPPS